MRIGTASCRMEQMIYLDGTNEIIAQAEHTFVLMDKSARKAVPIGGKARDKLNQLANSA
jgi:thioesterase-3